MQLAGPGPDPVTMTTSVVPSAVPDRVGNPGPIRRGPGPHEGPGPYGPVPYGLPWALMGRALMGPPWALMGRALVGPPGPLWARPSWASLGLHGPGPNPSRPRSNMNEFGLSILGSRAVKFFYLKQRRKPHIYIWQFLFCFLAQFRSCLSAHMEPHMEPIWNSIWSPCGPLWAPLGPLWAPLGPCGPGPRGTPGPDGLAPDFPQDRAQLTGRQTSSS